MKGWAACIFLTGCVVGDALPIGGSGSGNASGGDDGGDQIPTNGLVLDAQLVTTLTPAPLGIPHGDGTFDVNPLAAPGFTELDAGRALLKYIAICALPRDQALVVDGQPLHGFYGLAPAWTTQTCDASCQHWVMGCVLAHANSLGNPVHISLRGDHPSLQPSADLAAQYSLQEAGFYGAFGVDANLEPQLFACLGATATSDASQRAIEGRVCGLGSCGLHEAGACGISGPAGKAYSACSTDSGTTGGYADCRVSAAQGAPSIHEVITVYTAP